jgi:hypothetical protein
MLYDVGRVVAHLGGHIDVRSVVHRGLGVVARIKATTGALHDAAGRVGEVILVLRLGHAEPALQAPALGGPVLVCWLAICLQRTTKGPLPPGSVPGSDFG